MAAALFDYQASINVNTNSTIPSNGAFMGCLIASLLLAWIIIMVSI